MIRLLRQIKINETWLKSVWTPRGNFPWRSKLIWQSSSRKKSPVRPHGLQILVMLGPVGRKVMIGWRMVVMEKRRSLKHQHERTRGRTIFRKEAGWWADEAADHLKTAEPHTDRRNASPRGRWEREQTGILKVKLTFFRVAPFWSST